MRTSDHTARGFFTAEETADGERLLPQPSATSNWQHAGAMLRGMAVSAALAREAELTLQRGRISGLQPVRWTVDLCRPVALEPLEVRATLLRTGRRVVLAQVDLVQRGKLAATARGLFARPGDSPPGSRWHSGHQPAVPTTSLGSDDPSRLYFSDRGGWTEGATAHHHAQPKHVWQHAVPTVVGERPSPFQIAAAAADLASVTTHWGTDGLLFVNADVSLSLVRSPRGAEVGVAAHDRWEREGLAVGTAMLHDREGVFGLATVSAIYNAGSAVDPAARDAQR